MNREIFKKFIFFFLIINFFPQAKSADFKKFKSKNIDQPHSINWSKVSHYGSASKSSQNGKNSFKFRKYSNKNLDSTNLDSQQPSISLVSTKDELVIQSEKQSEKNNILYAEGNVAVSYKGKYLTANSLIYDKSNKQISAEGNISLIIGKQILNLSKLEYNFVSQKGYLLNVEGSISTSRLIDDLLANSSRLETNNFDNPTNLKRTKVLNTPDKIENWIFFSEKITIDGDKWSSKKSLFTNDLIELRQVKIEVNSLQAIAKENQLKFKSALNYLILDEKVSIPFWFGERTLTKSGEDFYFENRWNLGYDFYEKDGYFIGRKFNSINLIDDFVLDLEPQFLIQRSLNGFTKSYVKRGDSITGEKVKEDTSVKDYMALKSQISGTINDWNLKVEKQLNSFNNNKLSDAFRLRNSLSKEINFLDSKWNKSFYSVYRDRVWNGSLGESEIYMGYGSKLEKQNTWEINGINKKEILSLGAANLKAESLNSKDLVRNLKGNLFYSLEQKIPVSIKQPESKFVDSSFKYIEEPTSKGISLNTKLAGSYSFYEGGNHQEYIGFGLGPELLIGDFKNKFFDFTRISVFPFYKIKSGESVFKFDQISDKFTLNIALDQQIYGPLILKSDATINLDGDSKDYGDFINSKFSLNWKKRSYEFGIFYQPHNQSGGVSFKLFGFK